MKKVSGIFLALACAMAMTLVGSAALATGFSAPVRLSIKEPIRHNVRGGALEGRDFTLEFRLTVKNPVGFVELIGNTVRKEFLVVSDAENGECLEFDARHPTYNGDGAGLPLDQGCGDGVSEEVYFNFRTDPGDRSRRRDTEDCGTFVDFDDDRMTDDDPNDASFPPANERNKAYLLARNQLDPSPTETPVLRPVGAATGGVLASEFDNFVAFSPKDCYGYDYDEDLEGLVIMADVGAARVFDENFDLVQGPNGYDRIRNMAGMISMVSRQLGDRFGRSHVVAHMHVQRGMFEPLVVFDSRTGATDPFIGPTFLRRVDSGPVETFTWTTTPTSPAMTKTELDQLLGTLPDMTSTKIRAVLVAGPAPSFIEDRNLDGRYTAKDLEMMGYTLLSNQAAKTLNIIQQDKLEDFDNQLECPSQNVIFGKDLDGNGIGFSCDDGDGNSRSFKRIPQ